MPSQNHEALLQLFRNRPELAPKLMREALGVSLPAYTDVKIECADLTEVHPTEYRADLVLSLSDGARDFRVIVEVQLARDERKRFVWPAYVANLRARSRCPVCLLVVCSNPGVARWAEKPVELGCANIFVPRVLYPEGVPDIVDEADAAKNPELAVLSVIAHGHHADVGKAARIAVAAQRASAALDPDRSKLYLDVILKSVSDTVREVLMDTTLPFKYEYESDFARHYVAEGRIVIITRLLAARFGPLSEQVKQRIAAKSIDELDEMSDRLLTAASLEEALAPKS